MEGNSDETVTLMIRNCPVLCNRNDLIQNSDYFKAMFEGNFIESSQSVIKLEEVDVVAMKVILKLLWDKEYAIEEKYMLSVLQAACMLQFLEIKEICIEQIEQNLCISNCLKVWFYTEYLDLKNLYCKAKLLALLEFTFIKDTDYFLLLELNQIVNYLGNVNLQCSNELTIFESALTWYQNLKEQTTGVLLKLLHCVNFNTISIEEIEKISIIPSIIKHDKVTEILKCVVALKRNEDLFDFTEECTKEALSLLKSKERNQNGFPCILLDNVAEREKDMSQIICYDKFKRKRKYKILEDNENTIFSIFYVDTDPYELKWLFTIDFEKCENLDGFKMAGYKNFVLFYGGEFLLGTSSWNRNLHIYDVITEKWKRKTLPTKQQRRHFESCICGKYLYIVGGTGAFRVIQENMFWYDIEEDKWSEEVEVPGSVRQIKCCSFQNKLFILNINNKCAYTFCPETLKWTNYKISEDKRFPCFSRKLVLFSDRNYLYIVENKLFKLEIQNNELKITNETALPDSFNYNSSQTESVLSNDVLYSLSKGCKDEINEERVSLELFNINPEIMDESYQKIEDENLCVKNERTKSRSLIIFNVFHPYMVAKNERINDY